MKNLLIATGLFLCAGNIFSQRVIDTINMEPGYAKQVFYHIPSGKKHSSSLTQWHFAHTTLLMDNAIRLNHMAGVFAYVYPYGDNSAYGNFDTTGWATWQKPYNDMKSESLGALNQQKDPNNQWDFSWGVYDPGSHLVKGDSLYLITVGSGANMKLYKFMPIQQDKNGDFIFQFGPIDEALGTPDTVKTSKSDGGMFKYYNFTLDQQVAIETAGGDWHLNFNRYYDLVPAPGTGDLVMYPTNGVESKRGVEVAYANGVNFEDILSSPQMYIDMANSDTAIASGNGFTTGLTRVGGDWKFFNGSSFVVVPKKNYIVKVAGAIGSEYWAIRFLTFEGQGTGRMTLERSKLGELATNKEIAQTVLGMFPNPSSDKVILSVNHSELTGIAIYSMTGVKTQSFDANGTQFEINVSGLNPGQYIIEAQTNAGNIRKLFIKK